MVTTGSPTRNAVTLGALSCKAMAEYNMTENQVRSVYTAARETMEGTDVTPQSASQTSFGANATVADTSKERS